MQTMHPKRDASEMLDALIRSGSMADVGVRFARFLGLDEPVPEPVVHRALVDRPFLHHLVICRGSPSFLQVLFADPRNQAFRAPPDPPAAPDPPDVTAAPIDAPEAEPDAPDAPAVEHSSVRLVAGAARALARWGAAGLVRTSPEVFERRWSACQGCELLVSPPDRMVYKLVSLGSKSDPRVCSACGCVAQRKARVPTEHCPRADPADPSRDRWGEPRAQDR